ncbi:MAG: hypothetical protein ACI9Y1_002007 [Lentisphaeria bacterium]
MVFNLDVDFIDSLDDLAAPFCLERQQKKLEKQLHQIEADYIQSMRNAIALHREEFFQLDEKTRKVLKFISDIGFDLIPKRYAYQIINEVKLDPL